MAHKDDLALLCLSFKGDATAQLSAYEVVAVLLIVGVWW